MTAWLQTHPMAVVGLILWATGVLWLMPGRVLSTPRPRIPGLLLTAGGILFLCGSAFQSAQGSDGFASDFLFWLFSLTALLCGVLMITARNPAYAALWFALVTLSTCGLFLLRSAPFLAAATIIVYAGAVIVTFLFVIMLAQQGGVAAYDQKSRQAVLATVSAFVLLGAIVLTLQMSTTGSSGDTTAAGSTQVARPTSVSNVLSQADTDHPLGEMKGLGRSLFGDYLFAVELAGTLLLIACVGAIAIAPRREQGAI